MDKETNNLSSTAQPSQPKSGLAKVIRVPLFGKVYAGVSVLILLATTLLWSELSANLQRSNADQLVNSFLFESAKTFHAALLPGQHSFLLKWPLFWLVHILGATGSVFTHITVVTVLVTVAALAFIMYKIEKRPLVFGTLCLALASVLLLVPAQPYAGGLLPVNMAMLATRNTEYVLYIASLALLVRSPRLRSVGFWVAMVGLSILIASDKLFLSLSVGGAFLALLVYAVLQGWRLVSLAVRWLIAGLIATVGALAILWVIDITKLAHIVNQSSAGPYSVVPAARDLVLGIIYAILGLFTNFGANPAYDATIVRNLPHAVVTRVLAPIGITYVINALILVTGLVIVAKVFLDSLAPGKYKTRQPDRAQSLSLMLVWTTIVTFGAFIASNHYYAVDARYLTISVFAVFITAATWLRQKTLAPEKLVIAGIVITAGMLVGLGGVLHIYSNDKAVYNTVNDRNALVSQVLAQHPVNVLVGDYWRVIPTKLAAGGQLTVLPLSACATPQNILSSTAWQPDLNNNSFAYLLSLDRSLTNYPTCSVAQVLAAYGKPNSSTVVAGSLSKPKELLLFYDHGIRKTATSTIASAPSPATVVPVALDQLTSTVCSVPTDLNVVAHQDDDLLFMNPDVMHDIKDGHCVRTVYVTAGDDGAGKFYWLSREQGSEAAYDAMDGPTPDVWIEKIVELPGHQFITIASPKGNTKISLIFMHLPDGNLHGEGFKASHNESLERLEAGQVKTLHTVDNQSTYTNVQLTEALTGLMHTYQPSEIRTQANYASNTFPDHSDHMAVGREVKAAYKQYEQQQYGGLVTIPLKFYVGYPVHGFPQNVTGADLTAKEAVFLDYAKYDGGVCRTVQQCQQTPTYNAYLGSLYQNAY